jgi:Prolyl oligopeptidase family
MTLYRNIKKSNYLKNTCTLFVLVLLLLSLPPASHAAGAKKALTLQDMMKFKEIHNPLISEQGHWVVYNTRPDRGNGEVTVTHTGNGKKYVLQRGANPIITKNGAWVAAAVLTDFAEKEKAAATKNKKKKKPKKGMALLETTTGKIITFDKVKAFGFSGDSNWMFYCLYPEEKKKDAKKKTPKNPKEGKEIDEEEYKPDTSTLVLRRLSDGQEFRVVKTAAIRFDPASRFLAYTVFDKDNTDRNGLYIKDLKVEGPAGNKIHNDTLARYSNLSWSKTKSRLAFIFHKKTEDIVTGRKDKSNKLYSSALIIWDGIDRKIRTAISKKRLPTGWIIPYENKLTWTKDEERLYFGFKPFEEYRRVHPRKPKEQKKKINIYDMDAILAKRGVDVWHWNDPLINSHQKKQWKELKKKIYVSVYLLKEDRYVRLTDKEVNRVVPQDNPDYTLGFANRPYQREATWDGRYEDVYYINLRNGARQKILSRFQRSRRPKSISLSHHGRHVLYYKDKHWYLYSIRSGTTRNLTETIKTPFFDEDHDYPEAVPGYGIAGWTENDQAVLIYDKYDIWSFPTGKGQPVKLTAGEGRKNKLQFRVKVLDKEQKFFKASQVLLLTAYSHEEKYTAFYRARVGKQGVQKLIGMNDRTFRFVQKAKKAWKILFTRENFEEFPDMWVSGLDFKAPKKITDVNPQRKDFLWGKSHLIQWHSLDGKPLKGIVILPENYDKSKRYPVLVYYYRFFTQRLHRFNQVVINHRPCFPFYTGNDYVVFLPDIRFQVGQPGFAATKSLVPGVQKLIDLGIADPKAIGLHGHSWSGYQTAFIITQTDLFAAAIAGAPVSNMTSAYNGIRWESGLARQFQYEKSQSRIGASLLEAPHLYIENSPVFFADRINTPLLIQFGDEDGAVPWYQGIELYLTMRRLDKDCIFLQYNGEPHHLKKYPNKLDYTIKMKQYLDHYLKGKPAPDWINKGIPYQKKK